MAQKNNIELFKKAMWWDKQQNKPHDCLILDNTKTTVNLGYFVESNENFELTKTGIINFNIWKNNNNINGTEGK